MEIIFDKSLKGEILSIFDKTVDKDGFIVEKNDPSQRVLSPDGEEVSIDEFVGITKGSEVFIKSDLISLIGFSKKGKRFEKTKEFCNIVNILFKKSPFC